MPHVVQIVGRDLADDPRALRAARVAASKGYEVTALCALPDGVAPQPLPGIRSLAVRGGISTRSMRAATAARRVAAARELRGVWRIGRQLVFAAAVRRAPLEDADVIHAHDLETLAAGLALTRQRRSRLVYDAHELYADFEPHPPLLYLAWCRALETRAARSADAVLTVSPAIARVLEQRYQVRPVVVLNIPDVRPRPPGEPGSPPRAIYQGILSCDRGLETLVEAAALVPEVEVHLRGYGPLEDHLRQRAAATGARLLSPVRPDELVSSLEPYDIGVVPYPPISTNNELALPNKLFEYFAAGLAVVVSDLPELSRVVDETGAGLTFAPGDVAALADALRRLARPERLGAARSAAHAAASGPYSSEAQREVIEAVYEEAMRRSARRASPR